MTLPTWAVYLLSFGTPLSAFVGTLVGQVVTRQAARELDRRVKHAEAMRMLRWAAEQAISPDDRAARVGAELLGTMADSDLLEEDDQVFVDAALAAVVEEPVDLYYDSGGHVEVVEIVELVTTGDVR
jgi:hypothetical protein